MALGCRAEVCWVQESFQLVVVCLSGFLGRGPFLLSDGITLVYLCPVEGFSSMKIALGEDSANMLGPCLLDTCRSRCSSNGQLHFVHWLLFEELVLIFSLEMLGPRIWP